CWAHLFGGTAYPARIPKRAAVADRFLFYARCIGSRARLGSAEAQHGSGMRLTVIIPTLGRGEQVARLLEYLGGQTRLPDEVILSAPDATHVELPANPSFPVVSVFGPKGLAAQRNTAMASALAAADIITFFDD